MLTHARGQILLLPSSTPSIPATFLALHPALLFLTDPLPSSFIPPKTECFQSPPLGQRIVVDHPGQMLFRKQNRAMISGKGKGSWLHSLVVFSDSDVGERAQTVFRVARPFASSCESMSGICRATLRLLGE